MTSPVASSGNIVITAPKGARSSAGPVLTQKLKNVFFQISLALNDAISFADQTTFKMADLGNSFIGSSVKIKYSWLY